ncbi:Cna protein B-type domain protein [Rubripirellula tenax]|uniref:Cna protein B-type domain protein n=1 Tax=Rubripirellula tenax TaxID=2528015 RepID=A0A5C6FI46_9BACT|nr:SdrD B-like domain-containing protein [Rubripirellula tenax]TWU60560.1 Cna protein B-type domain protein [Rubripirellula tenax]
MVWKNIFNRFASSKPANSKSSASKKRSKRKTNDRLLRMEHMERRELMASDLGVITGTTFVDQGNDGFTPTDPPVLVNASGNLVAPGTAGATGVQIQLFNDDGTTPGAFDGSDTLVGTTTSDLSGRYRFDGLSAGSYFVQQGTVPQLSTPAPLLATIADDTGVRTALIDDYSATPTTVLANGANPNQFTSVTASEAIGGNRDVTVSLTSGGSLLFDVIPGSSLLTVSSGGDGIGSVGVQYDGSESTATLDATGLRTGGVGVSLGGGAPTVDVDPDGGLIALLRAENAGDQIQIIVHSDATNSSIASVAIPAGATLQELYVPFSSFTINTGTGADFNDVGAIETNVPITVTNNDVFVSIVEAIMPEIQTVNLANIQTVSLGGTLFTDSSQGGQNDGIRQNTEAGVVGVTVQLYELVDPNGTVDPATATPIATATTTAGGVYNFAGLNPGHYAVVVPASQFTAGAQLFGFANSTGNDPAPDADNNVDNDDNGTVLASGDVISSTITLESNLEPTNDADTDANTNTTLDFGFFPQIDLSITKTIVAASSTLAAGGNVVFDIVVQNAGPLTATNVVVEDVFPAGLTFTGLSNASGAFTQSVNGATVSVTLGTVAAGSTATFRLSATIATNQTTDLTNTATVSGTEVETVTTNNTESELVDLVSSDLRIEKTDLTDPVNAGNQFTYEITVTNDGPDGAAGVVVVDPLPVGVAFISGNVDGAANLVSFNATSREVTATVGTLANAATSTITLVVEVSPDAASPLINTASVTASPNTDPNPNNNSTDEDTTINREVDVAIDKTVSGTAIAGRTVTYTVVATNNGPSQARGVTVVDTLDANLTLVAGSFDAGTSGVTVSQSGQTLTFDVGLLDPSETQTFSFDVLIDSAATGVIPNSATINTTDTDSTPGNNTDSVDINPGRQVDLILTKNVDKATAVPGQDTLVYTFIVSHDTDSVSDASSVVVTDVMPAGLAGVVITAPTATTSNFANGTITVNFDSLPIGETREFTVTATVNNDAVGDASGNIVNPASVASSGTDLDTTNNSATATTNLTPVFDITVNKTVNNATPAVNGTVTYSVVVANDGPSRATGVVLTDVVPAGLTLQTATLDGVTGTQTGSNIIFPAIALAPNATATATLTFTVASTASGTITNTANTNDLSAAGEDDITNNSDTVDITVTPVVDLAITKTVSDDAVAAGDSLTYTINVVNNGPSSATNVIVTDNLPAGVTLTGGTRPDGSAFTTTGGNGVTINGSSITVNGGNLASAGTFSFTVTATVNAGVTAAQVNTASVDSDTNETALTNNTATASTTVDPLTGSIAGKVFLDVNTNGIFDTGDTGIEGVSVRLTGTDDLGTVVDRTVQTNASGDYVFAQLAAGTYSVIETDPEAFDDGAESAGTGAVSSNTGQDTFTNLRIAAGGTAAAFNFGELAFVDALSKRRFIASNR